MSSTIDAQISHIRLATSDSLFFKENMTESLAEYVARIMRDKNLSGYDIERLTHRQITQSYVNRIKNGEVKTPSAVKLTALAKGLSVTPSELFAMVSGMTDAKQIANERLISINFAYEGMPKSENSNHRLGLSA